MRFTTTHAADSLVQADRVVALLHEAFARLTRMPHIGRQRCDLGGGTLRSWPVFDWLVFYREVDREIRILRVVHGHQDLRQLAYEDNDWPDGVREPRLPWALLQRAS